MSVILHQDSLKRQMLTSLSLPPAAGSCGGRLSGEIPLLAWRNSRIPAGTEGRGQGQQQVQIKHATRSSVGGGLRNWELWRHLED